LKLWTSIIVAGAILAFAAPSAFTAGASIPADPTSGSGSVVGQSSDSQHLVKGKLTDRQAARIKKLEAQKKALAAKNNAIRAKNKALAAKIAERDGQISSLRQQVWDLTPHVVPVQAEVDPDADCRDYQLCSAEQDCRIWGNRCTLVNPPTDGSTAEQPATGGESSGGSMGDSGSTGAIAPVAAPLECQSMHDPAMTSADPNNYDWSC
jgi:hypothetical protein